MNSNFRLSVAGRGHQFILCGLCELLFKTSVVGGVLAKMNETFLLQGKGRSGNRVRKT
jgi:hypothetical protein